MEIYLTREALWYLEGQFLDSKPNELGGLLLGHKRGEVFFIEKVFPCRPSFFLSLENFWILDRHFEGKIIGFYSLKRGNEERPRYLQPFACGKIYLEIKPSQKKLRYKPSVIDYQNRFCFLPATLSSELRAKT